MSEHVLPPELADRPEYVDVRWLYHSGYYDGPLSGLVRLADGREAWAEMIDECSCFDRATGKHGCEAGFYRRYSVRMLSLSNATLQAQRHADFRRWVGTHLDYAPGESRVVRSRELWQNYYDKWPYNDDRPPLTEGSVLLGWFSH